MNKSLLALATVGIISALKRSGSKSFHKPYVWIPLGFPYPPGKQLYHATVGFQKIRESNRLKLRSQLLIQGQTNVYGAGGVMRPYLSTTFEMKRVEAIMVGVNVLRKLAQGRLSADAVLSKIKTIYPDFRHLTAFYTFEEWVARYFEGEVKRASEQEKELFRLKYNFETGVSLYRSFLMSYDEAFNPIFSSPDLEKYKNLKEEEIGNIVFVPKIERLSLSFYDAHRLGYFSVEKDHYRSTASMIDQISKNIKFFLRDKQDAIIKREMLKIKGIELDSWTAKYLDKEEMAWNPSDWGQRDYPNRTRNIIGEDVLLEWIPDLYITPQSTMTFYSGENEIEIWDPTAIEIDWEKSKTITKMGLEDEFYIPVSKYYDDQSISFVSKV